MPTLKFDLLQKNHFSGHFFVSFRVRTFCPLGECAVIVVYGRMSRGSLWERLGCFVMGSETHPRCWSRAQGPCPGSSCSFRLARGASCSRRRRRRRRARRQQHIWAVTHFGRPARGAVVAESAAGTRAFTAAAGATRTWGRSSRQLLPSTVRTRQRALAPVSAFRSRATALSLALAAPARTTAWAENQSCPLCPDSPPPPPPQSFSYGAN